MFSSLRLKGQGMENEVSFVPSLCLLPRMRDRSPVAVVVSSLVAIGRIGSVFPAFPVLSFGLASVLSFGPSPLERRRGVHHRKTGTGALEGAAAIEGVASAL